MKKSPNRAPVFLMLKNGERIPFNRLARRIISAEFRADIKRATSPEEREALREVRDGLLQRRAPDPEVQAAAGR